MDADLKLTTELLSRLVACDTASSDLKAADRSNLSLIDFAEDKLTGWGYYCERQEVLPGKFNLCAQLNPKLPAGLRLSGHSDTVPAETPRWDTDPLHLTLKDQHLQGLGACDMKGALACFMAAAQRLACHAAQHPQLVKRSLELLFTCDEETSMAGAAYFAAHCTRRAELTVIGEPTSLTPIVGHKGYCARVLTITGRGGHSSNPQSGLNAIIGAAQAAAILQLIAKELELSRDEEYSVPYSTLNLGMIEGGSCINQICPEVKLSFEIRPLQPIDFAKLDAMLLARLESLKAQGYTLALSTPYPDVPSFYQHDLLFNEKMSTLTGRDCLKVNYCTEASFLQPLSRHSVVLGPGDIAKAHQINEQVSLADLAGMNRILDELVLRYCLSAAL